MRIYPGKFYTGERKHRIALTMLFSGVVLLFLVVTAVIVSIVVVLLLYRGTLQFGNSDFQSGSLILNFILLSFVTGIILSAITSHFLLKPINKILNNVNRLASGDYSARIDFKGPFRKHPTINEFSTSFNAMAAELQKTEMLRSDFINNFSHEFKTPIVSIAGFAKLLKRGNLSEEKTAEYLDVIEKESMRLSQMATNVMSLTKVENQTILTDIHTFNLSEQLRTCMLMLEPRWTKKNLEIFLPDDEFYMDGNEEMMEQVWINLIDNAIKFSSDYGMVRANINKRSECLEVSVINLGDPIPEEKIDNIFNKFYQADESHATEGNGVGLAVVKKIVELHEGDIRVSCRDGRTTFTVILPAV